MRVTAEVGYLFKLKDDGSIFVGRYVDHVQAYSYESHRRKEISYPSSKVNGKDELSKYFPTHVGEVLGGLYGT